MNNRKGAIPKATRPTSAFQRSNRTIRSPPSQAAQQNPTPNQTINATSAVGETSVYQCEICLITDNADKVCCDGCNLWSHFKCAEVTSEVANRDWFCKKCLEKKSEPLITINSDVEGTASNNMVVTGASSDQSKSKTNDTNQEKPFGDFNAPPPVNTSQTFIDQQTSEATQQNRNRSKSLKSNSIKSTTSTSSRRKALALRRLEEEQQLKKIRDEEERQRRDEERKQREKSDQEYLDKKYSILDDVSDDSLIYDDYNDVLNLNPFENVRRWAETIPYKAQITDRIDIPKQQWEDFTYGKASRIVPQMSSTNVFNRLNSQAANHMDDPVMVFDNDNNYGENTGRIQLSSINNNNVANDHILEPLVNTQTISSNRIENPSGDVNVRTTQTNNVLLATSLQPEIQSNIYEHDSNSQLLGQSATSQPDQMNFNHQRFGQTVSTINDAFNRTTVSRVFDQQSVPNTQRLLFQPTSSNRAYTQTVASNMHRPSINNQTLPTNGTVAFSMGNSAAYPSNSVADTTFTVNNQPPKITFTRSFHPSFNTMGAHQTSTANHQLSVSQIPYTLPVMTSSQQSNAVQMPFAPNHQQSMVNYQQSYQKPASSMQSSGYQSSTNYQSNVNQPNSSVGLPFQFGNLSSQFDTSTSSSAPYVHSQQANSNWNSIPTMNASNASSLVPTNQANNTIGIRQLTREQIAARQVVPKALPKYFGGPEGWNKFISAYNNSTTLCGFNDYENLERIRESLQGDAHDAVESLLVHASAVPEIINVLAMMWGRPEQVIEIKIRDIQKEPAPKNDDLASLMKFAIKVRNLSGTIRNTGVLEHLRNPTLINTITDKLPTQIQLQWAFHKLTVGAGDLAVLGNWLYQIAEAASLVVRTNYTSSSKKKEQRDNKDQQKGNNSSNPSPTKSGTYVNTQVENTAKKGDQQSSVNIKKCPACNVDSCTKLASCRKFKNSERADRLIVVKENKLCTRCLGSHHFFRCRSNLECKVDGCKAKHHTLLHNHEKSSETSQSKDGKSNKTITPNDSDQQLKSNAIHSNSSQSRSNRRIDIFRIVPVMVYHKNRTIQTFAYFDDGSNMTTMETSLANELGITGTSSPLCVDWAFGQTHSTVESKIISTKISGCFDNASQFNLDNIRTVKELHLPIQSISQSWLDQFAHLRRIPIKTYESAKPRLLIGLQYSRLMVSLKTVEGGEKEPIACKTRLGWVVQGPSYKLDDQKSRMYSMNICECKSNDKQLHQLVKDYFAMENLGVKIPETLLESKEIQRAKQIMKSTTTKRDGRYETGLLWKHDNIELPDSYPMALKRLRCLETKMAKDLKLADNLCNQIRQFVDKGYIRKLHPEELQSTDKSPVWYLPTFPAFNPKKPEKVRIVWDGAAKVMNVSLNSLLLTGPDQLVPLPDILRRFRERLFAMLGDIKEMFHQIKVTKADQNVQRFLWRDGDSSRKPDVYVMMVVTFGLTCSPSQAQFVKNTNAMEFINEYPEAVNTIINNHYVDDMLDCEHTLEAAVKRVKEVTLIHKEGGFEIRNFLSNSKELLQKIGESTDQQNKNLNISVELGTERVLGMFWNTATDCFTFSLKFTKINERLLSAKTYPTKREVLRVLMSVFDPLGLLANYLIYPKILLQEIWRSNVDWDEEITQPVFKKWIAFIETLPNVEKVHIPRLYSPKLSPVPPKSIQMHVFVDASAEAFATAIYFRIEDDNGVDCCLAGSKTKVAPNKPMSIPRLELQGAVLGTRLSNNIKSCQTFKIDKCVYWTDSQTVMGWINSEARKYNQFVAFRIGEVLESSNQNDWRWIPSEHNVADEATKSKEIARLDSSSRWYKAPEFLYDKEETWFNDDIDFYTEEEIRPSFSMACREIAQPQLIDLERFSQWNRLLRAQAYVFPFVYNVRHKQRERRSGPLSQEEIRESENYLYRRAQTDSFWDEILIIKHNQKVSSKEFKDFEPSSILRTFSPYLDEHDVIRMHGRTDAATALCYDAKRPIILPRKHRITTLIVDSYHRRYKHINHFTALNEIRQKYAIPALRVVMKGIRTSCQKCKNLEASPKIPEMSELPAARLATHTLPFTYVGVDYFGPLRVRNGRKTRNRPVIMEKRWVLLFTCLTTRALWMEIAHSLDTNSCIMSIQNFMLRKGQPREIYSDNGSSFHSSDKELSDEFNKMNQKEVEEKFTNSEMVWKFNPPATPHMGGVWERLVRTVKSCLKQTMLTRCPNDEMLKNLIVEAEYIVNSRPLTYVSLESVDDEALTPNHILLGSSNGIKPLGNITEKDLARNTYKAVQVLANNFWRRFVLEYMPTLTKRTKWFKPVKPIKVGDVVVVVDENNERNTWPKGIVEQLLPGKRGIIRQVMVRTAKGIRRRSVGKLAILDVEPPSNEVVKQNPTGPVNEGGNVGQRHDVITVSTE